LVADIVPVGVFGMMSSLPRTGTQHLLDLLAPYVPDDFIDGHWPNGFTGGHRCALSAA